MSRSELDANTSLATRRPSWEQRAPQRRRGDRRVLAALIAFNVGTVVAALCLAFRGLRGLL